MPELTSTALVQDRLGDSSLSSGTLAPYIAAAEAAIARACDRYDEAGNHWLSASRTQYFDGERHDVLRLDFTPVSAVASVSIVLASGVSQSVTLTDLTCDGIEIADLSVSNLGPEGKLIYRRGRWPSLYNFETGGPLPTGVYNRMDRGGFGDGRARAKVAYTGGYAAAPGDLILAATIFAANLYQEKGINAAVQSERLGDYSYTRPTTPFSTTGLAAIMDLLKPYIRAGGLV